MNHSTTQLIQPINQSINLWLKIGLLIGAFIFCYVEAISQLITFWKNSYVYSYGFLIPFISIYLAWSCRDKLRHIQSSTSYLLGLPVILIGILMLISGYRGGVLVIQSLSIIITIAGVVLFLFGKKYFSVLLFPIAYLIFMIPIWDILTERLQFPFQRFSASTGATLLHFIGIPVHRDSVFLELPNITLEVANVCSGINNLIAVVAIAIPLAYITIKSWLRRIILVSGGIIIAALSNGLRVALIGILAYKGIGVTLHGPGHILQAMFVSFFGFMVLFIGAWALSDGRSKSIPTLTTKNALNKSKHHHLKNHLILTTGFFLIIGGYINFYHPSPVPLKMDLRWFPYEIGEWRGVDNKPDYDVFKELGVDHELGRSYRTLTGRDTKLYVGYYDSQKQGKELVNYKSEEFHHGASKMEIKLNPDEVIVLNKLIKREGEKRRVIVFWYDLNGRIVADRFKAKVYTIWDALIRGRTNGAVIMLSWDLENTNSTLIDRDAEDFIRKLIPILYNYLPR